MIKSLFNRFIVSSSINEVHSHDTTAGCPAIGSVVICNNNEGPCVPADSTFVCTHSTSLAINSSPFGGAFRN